MLNNKTVKRKPNSRFMLSWLFGEITLCSQVFETWGGKLMCENKLKVYER